MSKPLGIDEIKDKAENLKQYIWEYFFMLGLTHSGVKKTMNELLDLLDECPEFCSKEK